MVSSVTPGIPDYSSKKKLSEKSVKSDNAKDSSTDLKSLNQSTIKPEIEKSHLDIISCIGDKDYGTDNEIITSSDLSDGELGSLGSSDSENSILSEIASGKSTPSLSSVDTSFLSEEDKPLLSSLKLVRKYKRKHVLFDPRIYIPEYLQSPDSILKMVAIDKSNTLDSESAQSGVKLYKEGLIRLSPSETAEYKTLFKETPSNHLLIDGEKFSTRSGRVDTQQRVRKIVENGPVSLYNHIENKELFSQPPNSSDIQERNRQLKGTGFVWRNIDGDLILFHRTNITTAMDSKKSPEDEFFTDMKTFSQEYDANVIELESDINCTISPPLFSVSPQSAYGHQTKVVGVGGKVANQKKDNMNEHKSNLNNLMLGLSQAIKDYGIGPNEKQFSEAFELFIRGSDNSTKVIEHFLKQNIKPEEKLFLQYVNYVENGIKPNIKGSYISTKLILEVGIVAGDELMGVLSHKSCKSGQDRTLTQIAFQDTLVKNYFKIPQSSNEKAQFAAMFFEHAAMQATPVIEHARGKGGKIKWDLGSKISEQPLPAKMKRWFLKNKDVAISYLVKSCLKSDNSLDLDKKDILLNGLSSLTLKDIKIDLEKAFVKYNKK